MMLAVLDHPAMLLEILGRGLIGSAAAAALVAVLGPRDPRARHVCWLLVLLVMPAAFPLWFVVPEIVVPAVAGTGALVVPATSTPVEGPATAASHGLPLLVQASLLVSALWLARVGHGLAAVGRLRRAARPVAVPGFAGLRIAASERVAVPLTAGVFRPTILLPASYEGWTETRLRAVLYHEASHVRRLDLATTALAEVIVAAFWFNPICWIARQAIARAAEEAADMDAAWRLGSGRAYAAELVGVARALAGRSRRVLGQLHLTGPALERRVSTLLHPAPDRPVAAAIRAVLSAALVAACALGAASITPERPVQPPSGLSQDPPG